MDSRDVAISALQFAGLLAEIAGRPRIAAYAANVAKLVESNRDVEAHMAVVNAKLRERVANDDDFADAEARILADLDRLNS